MLLDAAKVAGRNGSPMFTEADVAKALQQVTTITPDVPFEIGEVTLTPRISGHIVGAVGLMIKGDVKHQAAPLYHLYFAQPADITPPQQAASAMPSSDARSTKAV